MTARVALVTGGSRGIGSAIALELGNRGYKLAVNYNSRADAAQEVCSRIEASGGLARAFQADVSDFVQVERLFREISETLGPVEVLVNNAGVTRDNLLMRMKIEEWDAVLKANLNSAFYCTKEAIRGMAKARWGRVVSVSSVVGLIGNAGQANYSASKAGLIGFSKSVAREYASRGVTVNVVAPGFIRTDMTGALKEEIKEALTRQIPIGSIGVPEDVAKTVAFFASDEAAYLTGQVLAVDGGMTMC